MKRKLIAQSVFISKSLLWSLLLYMSVMAVLNWDELKKSRHQDSQSWVQKGDDNKLIPIKVSVLQRLGNMLF